MINGQNNNEPDFPVFKPYLAALERKPPNLKQITLSNELEKYINEINPREFPQEKAVREEVLLRLSKLVNKWVIETLKRKSIPEYNKSVGQLFVSGSYRLGVNSRNDDVDTICCVPKYISKEDFFSEEIHGFMKLMKAEQGITHVYAIKEAIVPIIEVIWNGIELDVLLARLEQTTVPQLNMILDDKILIGLDDSTVRSINGPRVTELIIKLVPNYQNFCVVLRCVRKWAKVRGIYSNKLAFLGGVNYAILVAFCCQLYPTASSSKLLQRFFALYCEWEWPTEVRLCHSYERDYLHMRQWDPSTDRSEQFHVMPILTPAYPQQNSSYNVSHASLDIMLDEFFRAKDICTNIHRQTDDLLTQQLMKDLYKPTEFFTMFGSYIVIEVFVNERLQDDQDENNDEEKPKTVDLNHWSGYVESRLRKLAEGLQKFPLRKIYTLPTKFKSDDGKRITWYTGLVRHPNKMSNRKRLDLSYEIKGWVDSLFMFSKLDKEQCGMKATINKWSELPDKIDIFPNGKVSYVPLRKVWIHRRKNEQEYIRAHPNGQLERYSYSSFSVIEQNILDGKEVTVETVEEEKVTDDKESEEEQKQETLLLTKRLREEEHMKSKKNRGSNFNINLPILPGIDFTSMEAYYN